MAPTFKSVAVLRGYLEDDTEWHTCLEEAALSRQPKQMRSLFATILIFCQPTEPATLFNSFQVPLLEDIRHLTPQLTDARITQLTLDDINNFLLRHNKTLSDFPTMPQLSSTLYDQQAANPLQTYNALEEKEKADRNCALLNDDQTKIYTAVMNTVTSQNSAFYFIDGPGGTGKTFLYNTILHRIRSINLSAVVLASSGIASELLNGGRTAHSKFKIPIPIQPNSTCNITKKCALATEIKNAAIIIWDEAPMMHRHVFEAVHRTCCDIMEVDDSIPFGGKTVLLGGDFHQILPVVRHGREADVLASSLKNSFLWQYVHIHPLTENMRTKQNPQSQQEANDFQNLLLDIGNGTRTTYPSIGPCMVQLPPNICLDPVQGGLTALINAIFPDRNNIDYSRAILCATNEDVDNINNTIIDTTQKDTVTYLSADSITDPSQVFLYPVEFLNTLTPPGLPPHN
ncbi:ATP-dependent DNA helicase pif1-like [Lineus longissimus]|uniref:ATP-dependent DNA helicase pif1-like n=1 Tax=Lineus longissimus TaxID=88925 RepID=UPI00315C4DE9